jgi:hypothetical protein
MRLPFAPSSVSGLSRHTLFSAGFTTNMFGFEFSVQTRGNVRHGVALLCGFDTPSLATQGGQRLPSYFNIERGNPLDLTVPH